MKLSVFIKGILVVVASTGSSPAAAQIDSLAVLLHSVEPYFQYAPEVRSKLPELRRLATVRPDECRGLTIDVILQDHAAFYKTPGSSGPMLMFDQITADSQARVEQFLAGNYDVIATEGQELDRITIESLKRWFFQVANGYGITDSTLISQRFGLMVENSGVYRFIRSHPRAFVTGAESFALNHLHVDVLRELNHLTVPVNEESLDALHRRLSVLRSDLAIAKLVRSLNAKKKTWGCLVIGFNHRERVSEYLQQLQIAGTIYDTRQ